MAKPARITRKEKQTKKRKEKKSKARITRKEKQPKQTKNNKKNLQRGGGCGGGAAEVALLFPSQPSALGATAHGALKAIPLPRSSWTEELSSAEVVSSSAEMWHCTS